MDNDTWTTPEKAAEILKLSPADIRLMITGINKDAIADRRDGTILINLMGIEVFLQKMKEIINKLTTPEKTIPREDIWLKGRVAAQKIGVNYEKLLEWCDAGKIKGQKKARGWRIEESALNEFIKLNQELISSFKKVRKKSLPRSRISKPDSPDPPSPIPDNPPLPANQEEKLPTGNNSLPENPIKKDSKDDESQSKDMKCFTVRARKHNGGYYCRTEDIALAIHIPESTIKKWITDKMVKSIEKIESSGVIWYIEQESLRTFLEKYDILLTFDRN